MKCTRSQAEEDPHPKFASRRAGEGSSASPRESFFLHHPHKADRKYVRGVEVEKIEQARIPASVPGRWNRLMWKCGERTEQPGCLRDLELLARREIGFWVLAAARIGADADEPPARFERVMDCPQRRPDHIAVAPDQRQHILR